MIMSHSRPEMRRHGVASGDKPAELRNSRIAAALLSTCLPEAANVFVLWGHYGGYSGRSASAILITTILASITVPVALCIIMQVSQERCFTAWIGRLAIRPLSSLVNVRILRP